MSKIHSIVLVEQTPATDKQIWTACKQIARNYPAIAYKHTHQSNRKGGFNRPHIHLVAAPEDKEQLWLNGLQDELAKIDKYGIFTTSPPNKWEVIRSLPCFLNYLIGATRQHTPSLVYQSSDWNSFVQEHLSSNRRAW